MPTPPLFQSELTFRDEGPDALRDWLRERRKTPLQRLADWLATTLLLPILRGLLGVIEAAEALSVIPAPVWTIGSALVSIAVYSSRMGWKMAAGFIALLMIHECGHLLAARCYGTGVSAPIFIPYIGAVIDIKQPMRNAWEEAVLGISGPILGSLGAFSCLGIHRLTGSFYFAELAFFGFFMNLFNLIPLGSMDGGHVAVLLTRWLWIPGYVMLAAFVWFFHAPAAILMLVVTLPMVLSLFRGRSRKTGSSHRQEQARVSLGKRLVMGFLYIGLVIILATSMGWIFVKDIAPALHAGKSLAHSTPVNKTAGVDH